EGQVSAFRVGEDGLRPLPGSASGGSEPCYAMADPSGRHLFVANYGSGTVAAIPLDDGGMLGAPHISQHNGQGPDPDRQAAPHVHMTVPVDGGVLAVDLGTDALYRHPVDQVTGDLLDGEVVARFQPGTGPRHLARDG